MSLQDLHSLLLQAPLSQLNSVLADLRGLLSASSSSGANPRLAKEFEESLPDLLKRYHEQEGKVVRLPGHEDGSILAKEAVEGVPYGAALGAAASSEQKTEDVFYRDEAKSKRFTVDHAGATASNADSYKPASTSDSLRAELDRQLQAYLKDHYPVLDKGRTNEGACAQVWRSPLRRVKLIKQETQRTVQEDAMVDKLNEDQPVQKQSEVVADENAYAETAATDVQQNETAEPTEPQVGAEPSETESAEATAESVKAETYTPEAAPVAQKEVRPAEQVREIAKLEDADDEEDEGELVEADEDDETSPSSEGPSYVIKIVSGKSNSGNFWSGRLISTYTFHPSTSSLSSSLKFQIHYYENGNVQLNTLSTSSLSLLPSSSSSSTDSNPAEIAKSVIGAIKKYEGQYQDLLEQTYTDLNEKAFRALRRNLPVTRQKMNWERAINYKLGSDLAGAQTSSA